LNDPFLRRNFYFNPKISDDLFFSHSPFFSLFSLTSPHILIILIYILIYNIYCSLFLTKKRLFNQNNSSFTSFFLLEHSHASNNCFSKYWGDKCMGRPPTSNFLGDRPPGHPLGLRPWYNHFKKSFHYCLLHSPHLTSNPNQLSLRLQPPRFNIAF